MRIERIQPPVGYRLAARDLMCSAGQAAVTRGDARQALERAMAEHFEVKTAYAVSSGKAALTLILLALTSITGRRKVIVPAYTCFSVPSSIVKAGLEIVPCDIAGNSFDYDYAQLRPLLQPDVLCVLSVHLFGIPSDTTRARQLCEGTGIVVVEDAAQAMGGVSGHGRLGTAGDVGFFSLGRGKNVTCGSGGIILTGSGPISRALTEVMRGVPAAAFGDSIRALAGLSLMSVFLSPTLYWLPAGLPFLRLGETIFHEDFPIRGLSRFQALLLRAWPARLEALDAARRRNAAYYAAHVHGQQARGRGIPYVRFPILLPGKAHKRRLLIERNGRALGMSGMYPSSVAGIPELAGRLAGARFPEAERTAGSLITLPTHPLLNEIDRTKICAAVNAVLDSSPARQEARLVS